MNKTDKSVRLRKTDGEWGEIKGYADGINSDF